MADEGFLKSDERWMRLALEEAQKGRGAVDPNPMVGAVIVEAGQLSAFGHHEKDGAPHAERNAISNLGRKPIDGACMYVTLEPCSTQGRTGACTDAIIEAGFMRVVIGAVDPNPAHQGRGIKILEEAGLAVSVGVLAKECEALNSDFNQRMKDLS